MSVCQPHVDFYFASLIYSSPYQNHCYYMVINTEYLCQNTNTTTIVLHIEKNKDRITTRHIKNPIIIYWK